MLLTQIEKTMGFEVGRIGIEAQIENAQGLINVDAIATASPRIEAIIFGPADFMASIAMKTLVVGEQPPGYTEGDAYHYILMRILMAARANDLQAIDGPFLQIKDVDAYRTRRGPRRRARLRRQVGPAPGSDRRRERGLRALAGGLRPLRAHPGRVRLLHSEAGGRRGAVMLGDEMIDEASRKMALVIAGKGRAAGFGADVEVRGPRGLRCYWRICELQGAFDPVGPQPGDLALRLDLVLRCLDEGEDVGRLRRRRASGAQGGHLVRR